LRPSFARWSLWTGSADLGQELAALAFELGAEIDKQGFDLEDVDEKTTQDLVQLLQSGWVPFSQ